LARTAGPIEHAHMLKALELVGFKSFADKTRFEFDQGITVVVGPNGSGKSNVVDAIKWVLGEQSVKSLRGREMTDVIFNGSASRHPLNAAEITLSLDNSQGLLAIDTAEVHVTRRVYRNGEGEYFINRQPCRKRDIRDLLAGTGLGTGAYCIIEQGKVDSLLQSSPRDRRMIFEEAAGISRFRLKKAETLRRLERVEQNLLRLKDIVDEVEHRLRTVRSQASRAKRYREYTDRLQELRTQVAQADWRRLSGQLAAVDAELDGLRSQSAGLTAETDRQEAAQAELEGQMLQCGEQISRCETRLGEALAALAAREATIAHETVHARELEEEQARHRRQLAAMNLRAGDLVQQWRDTSAAVQTAECEHARLAADLADDERALDEQTARLDELREANEQRRSAYLEHMRGLAAVGGAISALESQAAADEEVQRRLRQRLAEADADAARLGQELSALRGQQQEAATRVQAHRQEITAVQQRLVHQRGELTVAINQISTLRQRQSGARERAAVLEELEQRQEGLGTGAKDILQQAQLDPRGPWRHVLGVVADLFHVNIQTAALLELALGEAVGYVVVRRDDEILDHLVANADGLAGRVTFVPIDPQEPPPELPELDDQPGVVGRADRFVETAPEFRALAARLLGHTWVVDTLPRAVELANVANSSAANSLRELAAPEATLRFITLAGEMVLPDGTLTLGPRQPSAGLISRRSELRALAEEIAQLDQDIEATEQRQRQIEGQIAADEADLQQLVADHRQASDELGEQRHREQSNRQQWDRLQAERQATADELAAAQQRQAQHEGELAAARENRAAGERQLAEMERSMAAAAREIIGLEQRRQDKGSAVTAAKINLAKSGERLENLRERLRQCEKDQHERRRTVDEHRQRLAECDGRLTQSSRSILAAETQAAELYLQKESLAAEAAALATAREAHRVARQEIAAAAAESRGKLRQVNERVRHQELAANEIRLQLAGLADRVRDDYGIELAALEHVGECQEVAGEAGERRGVSPTRTPESDPTSAPPTDVPDREQVETEIAELRRKIAGIGNVNLEALEELDELEARFGRLSAQYVDLCAAKTRLAEIIGRINADSRRLFADTLETIRGHFAALFRKLFGGGHADIALEEGADLLEAGIEINAQPPGKELRNISLLSGGEKTLTCVAMLLAIFRSKPAPFCVLDEVDAALDEANIGRFVNVLKDFLSWTQFIVVTHSKKTMTCANTLYGVTMQESGVSKRVSVRFEEVGDDGQIGVRGEGAAARQAEEEAA
jgi:chromosome segregation protein